MVLTAIFVVLVFFYSLVSQRLQATVITAPMLFTAAGAATALLPEAARELVLDRQVLLVIAELGLVMLLFTDAGRINRSLLKSGRGLPIRLLSAGMPLTIVFGAASALFVLSGLSWAEAGILATILAPTDAGLGQVIVSSERVPLRVRQSLSVEAGLNDGLVVPLLMLFIVLAVAEGNTAPASTVLARFLGQQLGYGTLIGLGVGTAGGWLLGLAHRTRWMAPPFGQLGVVALPLLCVILAHETGGSMLIAAFVAGFAVQLGFDATAQHSVEFAENWGQLLNYFVFFYFGTFVAGFWGDFTPAVLLYAVLSLTVVRMAPVALASFGSRLNRATVLFVGWFGPRGLASIVLALMYLVREAGLPGTSTIRLAVMATVLFSIVAHGLTAQHGIKLYARRIAALDETSPERQALEGEPPEPPHASM